MHKIPLLFYLIAISITSFAQEKNPNYNPVLAEKYGGDTYGMKSYIMVFLKTPADSLPKVKMTQDLMKGHLENIGRLVETKKLIIAGPYGKNEQNFRGLFLLDVETIDEAKALVATDPAIKAGVFDIVYLPWYGSAALPAYLDEHDQIWEVNP